MDSSLALRGERGMVAPGPTPSPGRGAGSVTPKVLVVDDEPTVQGFVVRVLTRKGYECLTARDAGEAIALAINESPALAISDIRMPGSDGTWLLGQLREQCPDMAIIMLTAVSEAKTAADCLKAGADDFLVKPINMDELVVSVDRALERVSSRQESEAYQRLLEQTVEERTAQLKKALQLIDGTYQDALGALTTSRVSGGAGEPARAPAGRSASEAGASRRELEPATPSLSADEQARIREIELGSVRVAGGMLSEGASCRAIAAALAEELVSSGGAPFVALYSRDGSESGLETAVEKGIRPAGAADLAQQTFSTGSSDVLEADGANVVSVPVASRGAVEAVLQVGGPEPAVLRLRAMSERLGLFLAAALTRELDAREWQRTSGELDLFHKLAGASRYSLDLEPAGEFVLDGLHPIVDFDVAGLLLLDSGPTLSIRTRCPVADDLVDGVKTHILNTLRLTCGIEASVDLRTSASTLSRPNASAARTAPAKLRTFVNVPISVDGSVAGLIHVSSGREKAFTDGEIQFLNRVAAFLGTSVQGVRDVVATVKGRLEQMVEHMADGVLMLDGRSEVVAMNAAARRILSPAAPNASLRPSSITRLLRFDPVTLVREERRSIRKLVRLAGVPYQAQVSPVIGDDGELAATVVAIRDFAEEKRADEMKTEFVSIVSHEMRTPLTAIKNALNLLNRPKLGKLEKDQRNFLGLARRNVEQLIEIINNLLDLSRMEASRMRMPLRRLSVREPIEDAVESLRAQAEERGLSMTLELDESLPAVYGDRDALRRVLVNLVGNALKYTDEGEVRVRVESGTESEADDAGGRATVLVSVSDTGVGIPPEEVESIFERFHQAHDASLRKVASSGLGLAITKELVAAHHGRIWVESEPGVGSSFRFSIPVLGEEELLLRGLTSALDRAAEKGGTLSLAVLSLTGPTDDGELSSRLETLSNAARELFRRSADEVYVSAATGSVVLVFPRHGGRETELPNARALEELEKSCGIENEIGLVTASYPDDADTAEGLYDAARRRASGG